MARAAAKRNRSAGKAARPVAAEPKRDRRKAEKTLEDELFFTRLRGHAKWAFALLAIGAARIGSATEAHVVLAERAVAM